MQDYFQHNFGLSGKRALVTGAGRGIGRSVAEALAAAGAEVAVHYNQSAELAREVVNGITAADGQAWAVGADLTQSAEVERLFSELRKHWDALDILVNNTGDLIRRAKIVEMEDELVEQVLRVNVHSAIYTTRAALPLLEQGSEPCIVNLGSVAAHHGGANGATLYAATKGAIHTFTRGLAKEVAPRIRVNAIAPGVALTDFHRRHTTEESLQNTSSATPLQRLGAPDDHGAAVVFLCGRGASFITGEVIEINGGLWFA